ncbi:MAG: 7-carboxy-7-deazaguanine synthase QueE [Kiritimatiellia bacterium]|nr:radical SAM protein [Lentisphaerota bacterium]
MKITRMDPPPMAVSEIFTSIQGESTRAGSPCFFIRLAGCNLDCRYCDTHYARKGAARKMSVAELTRAFRESCLPLVEVTGGEPLMQAGTPALLRSLIRCGQLLLETNGSLNRNLAPSGAVVIMDIKTPASGEHERMDWRNIRRLKAHDEVKFVIADRHDYLWAVETLRRHDIDRRCAAVLFSPVAGTLPSSRLAGWIMSDRLPVRLNLQWHRVIWPQRRRGV